MFEFTEDKRVIEKEEYNCRIAELRTKLFIAQQEAIKAKLPVLILIEGVPGAGRGEVINLLNEWMDSRYIRNRTFWELSDEAKERPEYWKFWNVLPSKGEIGLFFSGWYGTPLKKALKKDLSDLEFEKSLHDAVVFERSLNDDGMLIIKLWLHLSKKDHFHIMKKRGSAGDPLGGEKNIKKKDYDDTVVFYEKAIRMSDTAAAHWHIINCHNKFQRNISIIELLINSISGALLPKQEPRLNAPQNMPKESHVLDKVSFDVKIDDYRRELEKYQKLLNGLTLEAYERKKSTIILFEGWDAAGKGGAIRRIAQAIDARIRQTIQIAAPTDEEKARHYLWRFWRHIPKAGHVTIYDRSWYGRVLVERVEGFAKPFEWTRSYEEINHFEGQLSEAGDVIIKFWLHISPDEQLARFKDRESTDWKKYKITAEDWRNREKMADYLDATDEMLLRTSTEIAPWHVVAANDKRYARVEVLKIVCKALSNALQKS